MKLSELLRERTAPMDGNTSLIYNDTLTSLCRLVDAVELMCSQAEAGKRKADMIGSRIETTISYGEVSDAAADLKKELEGEGDGRS